MNLASQLPSLLTGAGGVGGVWYLLASRTSAAATRRAAEISAPAEMLKAMADYQSKLNAQSQQMVEDLTERMEGLQKRVDSLEQENERCRGENAQALQRIDSLEGLLRRNGIDIPRRPPPGALIAMEGDRTTLLAPSADGLAPA